MGRLNQLWRTFSFHNRKSSKLALPAISCGQPVKHWELRKNNLLSLLILLSNARHNNSTTISQKPTIVIKELQIIMKLTIRMCIGAYFSGDHAYRCWTLQCNCSMAISSSEGWWLFGWRKTLVFILKLTTKDDNYKHVAQPNQPNSSRLATKSMFSGCVGMTCWLVLNFP